MSVYSQITFEENGNRSFVRNDAQGRAAFFRWNVNSLFSTVSDYAIDSFGNLFDFRRSVQYDNPLDTETYTPNSPSPYDPQNTVTLGDGDDVQTYTALNDSISAGGGTDTIDAGGGHNIVFGQAGQDTLTGGNQTDLLFGGADIDSLFGGAKNDWLFGGAGADLLRGQGGDDVLTGGGGNDSLYGSIGDDILYDSVGSNTFDGGDGEDYIIAGDGNDAIKGGEGDDIIDAGGGNDVARGGGGNDDMAGWDGDDRMYGDAGDDRVFGRIGNDRLYGGEGNDDINGGGGDDRLYGEGGDDRLAGDDFVDAGGNDRLYGGEGNDRLEGIMGTDRLYGEAGDDLLIAGVGGQSYMDGGEGADTYAFKAFNNPMHRITGWDNEDTLNISDMLQGWDPLTSAVNDFVRINVVSTARADIEVNADGQGTDFKSLASVATDWTGVTAADLLNSGRLVLDHKLFTSDD